MLLALALLVPFACAQPSADKAKHGQDSAQETTRILIVTGGHPFEAESFFAMFDRMKGIQWQTAKFGSGAEALLNEEAARNFDVIVYYDMNQNRGDWTPGWVKMVHDGKPTVFLHHSLGSYADWPKYEDILGGHANFFPKIVPGIPNATYHEGLKYTVHIKDHKNPITRGLPDFEVVDEVYNHYIVSRHVHTLLTVDNPESGKIVGWTHRYGRARVVYILPGHGPGSYTNPTYEELVRRAIQWSAGRLH